MTPSPALSGFDRIYVLNLPERADRRREVDRQLRRVGLSLATAPVRLFRAVRPPDAGAFPSIGAHGCFMSHLGMLREAARDRLDSVLILEDDLDFAADAEARLPALLQALRRHEWSIFFGGCELPDGPLPDEAPGVREPLCELPSSVTVRKTHFIALRGRAIADAAAFLEAVAGRPAGDPAGGAMHVDGAYTWFRRLHPAMRTWIATPDLGYQRASRTDIHPLRPYDRWPMVRDLVQGARRACRVLLPAGR